MSGSSGNRGYHHGDLANTLMDDALVHIERDGIASLSLRALARNAGVSPTAPYRHFPSKRCLLAALATRGFMQLEAQMRAAAAAPAIDAESIPAMAQRRLMAMSVAYVNFAIAHPTTYQLMFGAVLVDFSEYEMLQSAAENSYAVLNETVELLQKAGLGRGLSSNLLSGTIWGAVHGVADLMIGEKATGGQLQGLDLEATGALQAIVALRQNPALAMGALFAPLLAGIEEVPAPPA